MFSYYVFKKLSKFSNLQTNNVMRHESLLERESNTFATKTRT